MNALIADLLKFPPAMALLSTFVTEIIKRAWEQGSRRIPNQFVPPLAGLIGAGLGSIPTVNDPLLGLIVGLASTAIHDIISPRADVTPPPPAAK